MIHKSYSVLNKRLFDLGLSPAELGVAAYLTTQETDEGITELAARFRCSESKMTDIINALDLLGVIQK